MATNAGNEARTLAAARMAEAAQRFITALDGSGLEAEALLPFTDAQRTEWFYTPTFQAGVHMAQLTPEQQQAAHALVVTGLSLPGYTTAATIMGLENILDRLEGNRPGGWLAGTGYRRVRDPQMYFTAIFGRPGDAAWGWHFGGHHVSVSMTIKDGAVISGTPLFFGSNPAEVPASGAGLLRPLAREEDLGRELMHALDAGQRATALLSAMAPEDIVQSNRPRVEDQAWPRPMWELMRATFPAEQIERLRQRAAVTEAGMTDGEKAHLRYSEGDPRGIAYGAMTAPQQEILSSLVKQYIDRLPDELAEVEWGEVQARGLEPVYFGWAGGIEKRQGHYYRIQGPRLLIEYDNVQNDANHIHAVWRDPVSDFGYDALGAHYASAH